jgi:hypothetical protein
MKRQEKRQARITGCVSFPLWFIGRSDALVQNKPVSASRTTDPAGNNRKPVKLSSKRLVGISKQRWVIERDYEELKQELALGHYEGRNWLGFHHHGTLCIPAYGFLMAERSRFSPSAHVGHLGLRAAPIPPHFRPRGAKSSRPTA